MGYENPYVERYDGMEESEKFGRCWRRLSSEFEGAGGLSRIEILPEMRAGAGFSACRFGVDHHTKPIQKIPTSR